MQFVYANRCRVNRHSEGPEGLLTSRGRAVTPTANAQPFDRAQVDPQEVLSTA